MSIKGIIFDADGVLLDSMGIWDQAPEMYLRSKGITPEKHLGQKMFAMSMTEGAEYIKKHYLADFPVTKILDGVTDTICTFYEQEVLLKPGVEETLRWIQKQRIPMTVATSSEKNVISKAFERLGIFSCFQQVFSCEEVGAGKDRPDIYYAAQQEMACRVEETIVFEDSFYALQTAKKAGFVTVGVYDRFSENQREEIQMLADHYLGKLSADQVRACIAQHDSGKE
ncbi:MAG: HAD family phosphatase [Roseburia porci]|nr:HAD family phosphatase [Roseburia sp.]MDD6742931.1 HAD family phosphatase [Roseburia porci]